MYICIHTYTIYIYVRTYIHVYIYMYIYIQEKTIKTKSAVMDQRNLQVERAVDDLVDTGSFRPLSLPASLLR